MGQQAPRQRQQMVGDAVDMQEGTEAPHQCSGRSQGNDPQPPIVTPPNDGVDAHEDQGDPNVGVSLHEAPGPTTSQSGRELRLQRSASAGNDEVDQIGDVGIRRLDRTDNADGAEELVPQGYASYHDEYDKRNSERLCQRDQTSPDGTWKEQPGDHKSPAHADDEQSEGLLPAEELNRRESPDRNAPAEMAVPGIEQHSFGGDKEQRHREEQQETHVPMGPSRGVWPQDHQQPSDPGCQRLAHMATQPEESAPPIEGERTHDGNVIGHDNAAQS